MVCHAVTVQNQGGENKVGILLRIIFRKGFVLSDAWFVKYAKSQHPENLLTLYCPLHRCGSCWYPPCFSSSSHSASPSLSTLTKLRVSFSVLAKRSFSGVFLPKTLQWFFPGMMWRISTQPLARLGLGSRDHFGAPSEQCTTWPPGICSFPSRSSIGPSSSLGGGRSWHQVIICIYYSKLQCIQPHHIN